MEGWAKDQGIAGSFVTFLADPCSDLTKALDLVFDAPPAMAVLGNPRCKRFALVVEDGVIKSVQVSGEGGLKDEDTFAEKMLTLV
jgi:2-Cys peroxiredoxin 5